MNWKYEASIWGAAGLMALISPVAGTVWAMAAAVFMANPLNDLLRPDSLMNRLHPENVEIREEIMSEQGCAGYPGQEDCVLIEWPDIAPYAVGFLFAGAALIGEMGLKLTY